MFLRGRIMLKEERMLMMRMMETAILASWKWILPWWSSRIKKFYYESRKIKELDLRMRFLDCEFTRVLLPAAFFEWNLLLEELLQESGIPWRLFFILQNPLFYWSQEKQKRAPFFLLILSFLCRRRYLLERRKRKGWSDWIQGNHSSFSE